LGVQRSHDSPAPSLCVRPQVQKEGNTSRGTDSRDALIALDEHLSPRGSCLDWPALVK
jgi:hypothetical protein